MTRAEATRRAYGDLVNWVFTFLRNGVGKDHPERETVLQDLGDAMHNVSVMLHADKEWIDDEGYRSTYLSIYDRKWADDTGLNLTNFVEKRIREHLGTVPPADPASQQSYLDKSFLSALQSR